MHFFWYPNHFSQLRKTTEMRNLHVKQLNVNGKRMAPGSLGYGLKSMINTYMNKEWEVNRKRGVQSHDWAI